MHRHFIVYGAAFAGLMAFSLFAGWAFFGATSIDASWRYVAAGVVLLAGVAGFLAALTLYSANRRFDERMDADLGPPRS